MLKIVPVLSQENPQAIEVVIETDQLRLFSLNHRARKKDMDIEKLCRLYADETNMKSYANGKPRPAETVISRYTDHVGRWSAGNPFSAFIIEDKKGQFIGHAVFGGSGKPGIAEIAIVIDSPYWRQGFGTEVVAALTYEYASLLADNGYKLGDESLIAIRSTAHPDNGTTKIFTRLGYVLDETIEHADYGATRNVFSHIVAKPDLEPERTSPKPSI